MINLNIKLTYKEKELIFNQYSGRENYYLGKFNNKILIWNKLNDFIMDFYYDDNNDQYFDLNIIYPYEIPKNLYFINRLGIVKGPRKILKSLKDSWDYPQYKIKGTHKKIHILLSKMFVPNIDNINYNLIDHIDRNKNNYSLSNLRWVNSKMNMNNRTIKKWTGIHIYEAYNDKEYKDLAFKLSDELFYNKYTINFSNNKAKALRSYLRNCKFEKYYWKVIDMNLLNYLTEFNIKNIDDSLWKLHWSKEIWVHPTGLIKNKRGNITPGNITNTETRLDRVYNSSSKNIKARIHDLVAEVFLNDNKPLSKYQVVDHIDTNSLNNQLINLRLGTLKDNMKNPLTRLKLSRQVIGPDGTLYNSLTDCALRNNTSVSIIWARLNNRRPSHGFKYK